MALSCPGFIVSPESSKEKVGGCRSSFLLGDVCQGELYRATSENTCPSGVPDTSSLNALKEDNRPPISHSFRSSFSSFRSSLPVVLEESESTSSRDGPSVWDVSATSSFSFAASLASSSRLFFRKGVSTSISISKKERSKARRLRKGKRTDKFLFTYIVFWPLRKLRDGYVRCMMGLDGNGDLSSLAQGSNFGTSSRYFGELPISRVDWSTYLSDR
ncbi:hypothetical protein KP509_16G053000 [Ceratopteris richardii]|uniref:Uncharacterized protein n=1 Tax=Ceratopteris richardii TaxID=49495 RepID=A0A8T2T3D0_CERRI|nr:hypothetical protein KP509_16G053000 [Ceratopteris richardii]